MNVTRWLVWICGGIGKQLAAGECIVGCCMVNAADWMLLGDWMICVGDWETVDCRRVHSGELHVECCWLNVTGWLNGMCGGLGNSWLQESAQWGAACWVLLTECYWVIEWDLWGIGKQLAVGECIVGSFMESAADWILLGDWIGCVGDWETVVCGRVHSGEIYVECCWLNVTGW